MSVRQLSFEDLGSVAQLRENYEVELKAAQGRDGQGAVPDSIWETYSAFANTKGGWIVLGVEEHDSGLAVVGITSTERLSKEIWDTLNNRQKVSVNLLRNEDVRVVREDGESLVVIKVPTAGRKQRPVYIGANPIQGTYLRNHEGDYKADEGTVRRMLAEAEIGSRDSKTLPRFTLGDLDSESVEQYRNLFQSRGPQHPFLEGSDEELLRALGGMKMNRTTNSLELTVAGLLMFGQLVSIREQFPHFHLDFQEQNTDQNTRWLDRVTTDGSWPGNLFQFFRRVFPKLTADIKVPFQLDETMRRVDETEVQEALREALVNTLIHADYEASTPIRITKHENRFQFRNPGRLRIPREQALEGGVSDCRNPAIQTMFQMIGAGEKAGSGIPTILRAWRDQHWRAPSLEEDVSQEATTLVLPMASLLPDQAVEALTQELGDEFRELGRDERIVLVTTWLEEKVTHERLMQILNVHSRDLTLLLEKLVQAGLLIRQGSGRGCYYELASWEDNILQQEISMGEKPPETNPSNKERSLPNSSESPQNKEQSLPNSQNNPPNKESPPQNIPEIWSELLQIAEPIRRTKRVSDREQMKDVIEKLCSVHPLTNRQLAQLLTRNADGLRDQYLSKMVANNRLRLKHPGRISHPDQRYISTPES